MLGFQILLKTRESLTLGTFVHVADKHNFLITEISHSIDFECAYRFFRIATSAQLFQLEFGADISIRFYWSIDLAPASGLEKS